MIIEITLSIYGRSGMRLRGIGYHLLCAALIARGILHAWESYYCTARLPHTSRQSSSHRRLASLSANSEIVWGDQSQHALREAGSKNVSRVNVTFKFTSGSIQQSLVRCEDIRTYAE